MLAVPSGAEVLYVCMYVCTYVHACKGHIHYSITLFEMKFFIWYACYVAYIFFRFIFYQCIALGEKRPQHILW